MVHQLIAENQLADAERVCREILSIEQFAQPERLRGCQVSTINALLQAALRKSGREGVTDQWLQSFVDDFPNHEDVKSAVSMVRRLREHLGRPPVDFSSGDSMLGRRLIIVANLIVIAVVLACLHASNRRSNTDSN